MKEDLFMNIILSFAMLVIGGGYLSGCLRGTYKYTFDLDKLFFSRARDQRVFKIADQWAFVVCSLMAGCTLANGILSYVYSGIPNVSAVFLLGTIFLSFVVRYAFVVMYKNTRYELIPISWPFTNKRLASWFDD